MNLLAPGVSSVKVVGICLAGRSVRRSSCGCHCYHTRAAESLARRSHTALMSYGGGCTHTHKKGKKKHHISATLNTNSDTRPGHTYMLSPPILRASTHTHSRHSEEPRLGAPTYERTSGFKLSLLRQTQEDKPSDLL